MTKTFNVSGTVTIIIHADDEISAIGKANEVIVRGVIIGSMDVSKVEADWDNSEIEERNDAFRCIIPFNMPVEFPNNTSYLDAGDWIDEYGSSSFRFVNPYKTPGIQTYMVSDLTV